MDRDKVDAVVRFALRNRLLDINGLQLAADSARSASPELADTVGSRRS